MYKYIVAGLAAFVATVLIVCVLAIPQPTPLQGIPWNDGRGNPSNYPVNLEMRSTQDNLAFVHKVYYDMNARAYVYYYRIEYTGDSVALFSWEVLNMQEEQLPFMVELVPNEKQEFTFKSASPPMMYEGYVGLFQKQPNGRWIGSALTPQMGPIPSVNYPELEKEKDEPNESPE